MKWITRLFSVVVFLASFGAAMYLGYKLFKGPGDDDGYLFGDAMYDPADKQDLYEEEPAPVEEEQAPATEMAGLEPQSPLVH